MGTGDKKPLLWVSMLFTFFLGFESGGFQLALLRITREFSVAGGLEGAFVTAQFIATIIFPFALGWLSDRIGKKKVLMMFSGLVALVCVAITALSGVYVFVAGIFLLGAGFSMCEATAGAAIADAFPGKQEKYMNYVQAFFCLGAAAGPPAADIFFKAGYDWRVVFAVSGAAFAVVFVLFAFIRFETATAPAVGRAQRASGPRYGLLLRPACLVLIISITVYVATETAVAFFLDYLFAGGLGAPGLSAAAISLFWLSMMLSRLLAGAYGGGGKLTAAAFLVIAAFAFVISATRIPAAALVCCFALGFAHGPVWPNLVGLASREYPSETGLVTGAMSAASGVGGALSPVAMSLWADRLGIKTAFTLFAFISLAGFFSVTYYFNYKKRNEVTG